MNACWVHHVYSPLGAQPSRNSPGALRNRASTQCLAARTIFDPRKRASATAATRPNISDASRAGWGYPPGSGDNINRRFVDDGQRLFYLKTMDLVTIYDKNSRKWTQDDAEMPLGFCVDAAAAWSGDELIAWSGYCDSVASSLGARYQPPAP
jgi:hypothetical protein